MKWNAMKLWQWEEEVRSLDGILTRTSNCSKLVDMHMPLKRALPQVFLFPLRLYTTPYWVLNDATNDMNLDQWLYPSSDIDITYGYDRINLTAHCYCTCNWWLKHLYLPLYWFFWELRLSWDHITSFCAW